MRPALGGSELPPSPASPHPPITDRIHHADRLRTHQRFVRVGLHTALVSDSLGGTASAREKPRACSKQHRADRHVGEHDRPSPEPVDGPARRHSGGEGAATAARTRSARSRNLGHAQRCDGQCKVNRRRIQWHTVAAAGIPTCSADPSTAPPDDRPSNRRSSGAPWKAGWTHRGCRSRS